ncbi:Crp/Fnr family transcriptional regulator [Azospirillum sp. sgz301742]
MKKIRTRRHAEAAKALSAIPPFDRLSLLRFCGVTEMIEVKSHARGAVLFARGTVSDVLYILLSGTVALEAAVRDGQPMVVEVISRPGPLDAIAALAGAPCSVQAVATRPVRIATLPVSVVRSLTMLEPAFAAALFGMIAQQYHAAVEQIGDLKAMSATERLGSYLLQQADHAEPADNGGVRMRLPIAKNQIAQKIGMVPESLSRAFMGLRRVGVTTAGRDVAIADVSRLRAFCANRNAEPARVAS